ncbi:hypothetical protein CC80DRAFT_302869 [Byssothecium circinans]|uniref:Uncharacterized protein n=1 Tax=Byssothecium circinans TaxID=147558 RepID=A0A6A5U5F2_9PLEO|nr:hypothetical protein CC80DRAFT_302869 [Byssothecium circinans]
MRIQPRVGVPARLAVMPSHLRTHSRRDDMATRTERSTASVSRHLTAAKEMQVTGLRCNNNAAYHLARATGYSIRPTASMATSSDLSVQRHTQRLLSPHSATSHHAAKKKKAMIDRGPSHQGFATAKNKKNKTTTPPACFMRVASEPRSRNVCVRR